MVNILFCNYCNILLISIYHILLYSIIFIVSSSCFVSSNSGIFTWSPGESRHLGNGGIIPPVIPWTPYVSRGSFMSFFLRLSWFSLSFHFIVIVLLLCPDKFRSFHSFSNMFALATSSVENKLHLFSWQSLSYSAQSELSSSSIFHFNACLSTISWKSCSLRRISDSLAARVLSDPVRIIAVRGLNWTLQWTHLEALVSCLENSESCFYPFLF